MNQIKITLLAGLLGGLSAAPALAQPAPAPPATATVIAPVGTVNANINITPKRVTFDASRRTASVYLFNQGDAPTTVDVTLVDRVMLADGLIMAVEDAQKTPERKAYVDKLKSAQAMVQISPRRVTLAPGKGQTVRLRVGNVPDTGAAAEYRTHLTITNVPARDTGVTAQAVAAGAGANGNQLSFHVTTVFGLSIPLIIRTGAPDVRAGLENAHMETDQISADGHAPPKPTPVLVVDLVRHGASSVYGAIQLAPAGAKRAEPLALARGVAVYPETDRRTVRIPLSRAPKAGEKLEVTFTDDDTSPGKVIAKSDL
ncbi:MAG: hypothetical protein JWQ97_2992 [Phenylobacterium sp.]|nr:hypothetical protein [Phenylobacterium sp.]